MPQDPLDPRFDRRRAPLGARARHRREMGRRLEAWLREGGSGRLAAELPPELRPAPTPPSPRAPRSLAGRALRGLGLALLLGHAAFVLGTGLLILGYRFADPPATLLMAYRKWGYGWKLEPPRPLPLRALPSYLRSMLISVEDGKFYEHHGLDFEAFRRAYEVNSRLNRPLYGGSTLTMQVARTLFLVPEKSYLRKYLEVIVALELELLLPKARILELYFGYAEWGKGLFGIEAAARKYFGKRVAGLSREEAARLIALLSSPIKYGPWNLERSGILRERYRYLERRYLGAASDAGAGGQGEASAGKAPEPASGAEAPAPAEAALPATAEAPGTDAPAAAEGGSEPPPEEEGVEGPPLPFKG